MDPSLASFSLVALASAFWLGILTSISPCPLATNIAAISFIGRRVERPGLVFLSGALYAIGRTLVYLALAALIVGSVLSVPELSRFLQKSMNLLLGPLLILVGMFLLELIAIRLPGSGLGQSLQMRLDALGLWGALPLGMLFALTFCPVSAALYFGSLIPLSVQAQSSLLLPALYGVGTAVPALVFAVLVAVGARSLGQAFNALAQVEWWARRLTGVVFIAIGVFLSLKFVFGIL